MATVEDVLGSVEGLRGEAAARLRDRFTTVADLAAATVDDLVEVNGVGRVMAERIHASAAGALGGRATAARDTPASASSPAADARRLAGRAVGAATGTARVVTTTAARVAASVAGRALPLARRALDRVAKRGR